MSKNNNLSLQVSNTFLKIEVRVTVVYSSFMGMYKKNYMVIWFMVVLPVLLFGQNQMPNEIRTVDVNLQNQKNRGEVYHQYVGVEGTPYMDENFASAMLYPDEKTYLARYNAKDDEFEIKLGENRLIFLDNSRRDYKVRFEGTKKTYVTLYNKGERMPGYYVELIGDGEINVYVKETKRYVEGTKAANDFSKNKDAYFTVAKEVFYIRVQKDGEIMIMPTKRKLFAKLFGSKEKSVGEYIKENKIALDKVEDLNKVIEYILAN